MKKIKYQAGGNITNDKLKKLSQELLNPFSKPNILKFESLDEKRKKLREKGLKEVAQQLVDDTKILNQEKAARKTKEDGAYMTLPNGETKLYKDMDFREKGYVDGQSLRNKGRWDENDPEPTSWYNPVSLMYNMAANIGESPLQAKMTNSNLPYLGAVAAPLAMGALAGIGANTTGQFVNNIVNPLAGTGDLVNSLGNKYLPNAYKLNPFAFKPNPNNFYRTIGEQGLKDVKETGILRANPLGAGDAPIEGINMSRPSDVPYFAKGEIGNYPGNNYVAETTKPLYARGDVNPITNQTIKGRHAGYRNIDETGKAANIPVEDVKLLKKDWLQGYKEIKSPKFTQNTEIPVNNTLDNSSKNLEDLNYARDFFKDRGYNIPENLERIAKSDLLTDRTIRGLVNRDNTFARGVSTNWAEIEKRNPEILRHLEGKGIDWKANPQAAAEYMATHIPIQTGYGRASLNQDVFNKGMDGLYTSNSIPTAEGYTYGDGFIVKAKRPTNFTSNNRKDWIDNNKLNYYENRLPRSITQQDLDEIKHMQSSQPRSLWNSNSLGKENSEKVHKWLDEADLKEKELKTKYGIAEDGDYAIIGVDESHPDFFKLRNQKSKDVRSYRDEYDNWYNQTQNDVWKTLTPPPEESISKKLLKTEHIKKINLNEANNIGELFDLVKKNKLGRNSRLNIEDDLIEISGNVRSNGGSSKDILAAQKEYLKTFAGNDYAHYIHLGTPGEKVLEAISSKRITPDIWKNKSRAHTNTYSRGLSAGSLILPVVGGAALSQQKLGGTPVNPQGLFEEEGPVIIPSNNITMVQKKGKKQLPNNVLAIPDNDQPIIMKKGNNYKFPNSKTVKEIPLFGMQKGGKIQPLIVNNPNDPRLKAYQDSLNLYKNGIKDINFKTDDTYTDKDVIFFNKSFPLSDGKKYYEDGALSNTASKIIDTYKKSKIDPIGYYRAEGVSLAFKKPEQPVTYQKPVPERVNKQRQLIRGQQDSESPMLQQTLPTPTPLQFNQNTGDYGYTYRDENSPSKQTTEKLNSKEELEALIKSQNAGNFLNSEFKGNSGSALFNRKPSFSEGGWIKKKTPQELMNGLNERLNKGEITEEEYGRTYRKFIVTPEGQQYVTSINPKSGYSATWRDETSPNKQKTILFPDAEGFKRFTSNNPEYNGQVTQKEDAMSAIGYYTPSMQMGGYNPLSGPFQQQDYSQFYSSPRKMRRDIRRGNLPVSMMDVNSGEIGMSHNNQFTPNSIFQPRYDQILEFSPQFNKGNGSVVQTYQMGGNLPSPTMQDDIANQLKEHKEKSDNSYTDALKESQGNLNFNFNPAIANAVAAALAQRKRQTREENTIQTQLANPFNSIANVTNSSVYLNQGQPVFQEGGVVDNEDPDQEFEDFLWDDSEDITTEEPIQEEQEVEEAPEEEIPYESSLSMDDFEDEDPNEFTSSSNGYSVEDIPPVGQSRNYKKGTEQEAYNYLIGKGLSSHVSAGIVGNLIQESGLNPNATGDGGKAYGIAQWHPDRRKNMKDKSFYGQLEYLVDEANKRGDLDKISRARTPEEAAYLFAKHFEKPKRIEDSRMQNARNVFNSFNK